MMKQPCLYAAVGFSWILGACAESRECERERMALEKTFEQLQLTAANAKSVDPERATTMGAAATQAHLEVWTTLETNSALLRSAFATEQVTWNSAAQTITKSKASYATTEPKTAFEVGFGEALTRAETAFNQFRTNCR